MTTTILYTIYRDVNNILDYPKMYKIYLSGEEELLRTLVDFSEAPRETVAAYVSEFRSYVSELLLSIGDIDTSTPEVASKLRALTGAASYIEGAIPLRLDEQESESE
jgi:hypothetical protein